MIYDYYHYNSPEIGNKHLFAYGWNGAPLSSCGIIEANTRAQAQTVLNENNRAWDADNILLDYSDDEIRAELEQRKARRKTAGL